MSINDTLGQRLSEEAGRRATTTSALVEAGLRLLLSAAEPDAGELDAPPLPSWDSGSFRVDIADRDALYRFTEEDKRVWCSTPMCSFTPPIDGHRATWHVALLAFAPGTGTWPASLSSLSSTLRRPHEFVRRRGDHATEAD